MPEPTVAQPTDVGLDSICEAGGITQAEKPLIAQRLAEAQFEMEQIRRDSKCSLTTAEVRAALGTALKDAKRLEAALARWDVLHVLEIEPILRDRKRYSRHEVEALRANLHAEIAAVSELVKRLTAAFEFVQHLHPAKQVYFLRRSAARPELDALTSATLDLWADGLGRQATISPASQLTKFTRAVLRVVGGIHLGDNAVVSRLKAAKLRRREAG